MEALKTKVGLIRSVCVTKL